MYNVYALQGGTTKHKDVYEKISQNANDHGKPLVVAGDHNNKKEALSKDWGDNVGARDVVFLDTEGLQDKPK